MTTSDIFDRFLTMKLHGQDEKQALVSKCVYKLLMESVEEKKFPATPTGISAIGSVHGIEIIAHEKMPDDEMVLVPHGMDPEVALEIYLAQRAGKRE